MELLKTPPVAVRLSLGSHGADNIPQLEKIEQEARNFFGNEKGIRAIYYEEAFARPHERLNGIRRWYSDTNSYFEALLLFREGSVDLEQEKELLEMFIQAASKQGWRQTAARIAGIDPSFVVSRIFSLAEYRMLDRLASSRPVQFNSESYSEKEIEKLKLLEVQHNAGQLQVFRALGDGDTSLSVKYYRDMERARGEESRLRHNRIKQKIKEDIDLTISDGKTLRIFGRFGAGHFLLKDSIEDFIPPESQVVATYDYEELALASPRKLVAYAYELEKSEPEDEEVIRAILELLISSQLTISNKSDRDITRLSVKLSQATPVDNIVQLMQSFPSAGISRAIAGFIYSSLY